MGIKVILKKRHDLKKSETSKKILYYGMWNSKYNLLKKKKG
jgi:hypothetical protein